MNATIQVLYSVFHSYPTIPRIGWRDPFSGPNTVQTMVFCKQIPFVTSPLNGIPIRSPFNFVLPPVFSSLRNPIESVACICIYIYYIYLYTYIYIIWPWHIYIYLPVHTGVCVCVPQTLVMFVMLVINQLTGYKSTINPHVGGNGPRHSFSKLLDCRIKHFRDPQGWRWA